MLVFAPMNRLLAGSILGLMLVAAFAGCSRAPQNEQAPTGATPSTQSKATTESNAALKGMVSGVSAGKDEATVDLKFELKARPQIGQPLTIEVVLLPKLAAETMRVTYISTDALAVQPVTLPGEYHGVQAGSVYHHEVSVIPRDNGVYYVSAVVLLDSETGSLARTFAIPVVVGPPPEAPAVADQTPTQDSSH